MQVTFQPAHIEGVVNAPASKSELHRMMICAGLSEEGITLYDCTMSSDIEATARCLRALGADVSIRKDQIDVSGWKHKPELLPVYDCGESGSTLRFFVPVALALTHGGVFRMHGRLSQRPMEVYRDLFVPRGVHWRMGVGADGTAELTVMGGMVSGAYELPGDVSSQFVSGLLFALPLLPADSTLTVRKPVESAQYINMTIQALRDSGILIDDRGDMSWYIHGGQRYQASSRSMDGDWSQAAVLLCMGAIGGDVTVRGLHSNSLQGDRAVVPFLRALGANVEESQDTVRVYAGKLHGTELDMRNTPDIGPMLALVCQLAEGESRLTGCSRLRLKESDRLEKTVDILNQLGGNAHVEGDTILIRGVDALRGGVELDRLEDHRMVMLASAAATVTANPVTVSDAEALEKSWPAYLDTYRQLGGIAH